ncbi:hypothetical protein PIB30_079105 [Stylosanthes scabra]|uniref:Uncharacterized protein n=1 Tax=Stylosanthes scabra TaxID=79078 RepID=A0ABU6UTN1_9FABA|nr:hypothetical protein [Stylosanthes scabra]
MDLSDTLSRKRIKGSSMVWLWVVGTQRRSPLSHRPTHLPKSRLPLTSLTQTARPRHRHRCLVFSSCRPRSLPLSTVFFSPVHRRSSVVPPYPSQTVSIPSTSSLQCVPATSSHRLAAPSVLASSNVIAVPFHPLNAVQQRLKMEPQTSGLRWCGLFVWADGDEGMAGRELCETKVDQVKINLGCRVRKLEAEIRVLKCWVLGLSIVMMVVLFGIVGMV